MKALEVMQQQNCEVCLNGVIDLLLGHFPSLVYARITLQTKCTKYAITNCHWLKYLYYNEEFYTMRAYSLDFPSLSSNHLQQLFAKSFIDLSASSAQVTKLIYLFYGNSEGYRDNTCNLFNNYHIASHLVDFQVPVDTVSLYTEMVCICTISSYAETVYRNGVYIPFLHMQ